MSAIPACRCCGLDKTADRARVLFECLQYTFDDLICTCGTRCPKHNATIGGSKTSGHMPIHGRTESESVALDMAFKVWTNAKAKLLAMACIRAGATGVEINYDKRYVHADYKPRVYVWKIVGGKEIPFFEA